MRVEGGTEEKGNVEDVGSFLATREQDGNLWDSVRVPISSFPLIPGESPEEERVGASVAAFASRAARTGTPSGPSVPTFHASCLPPSLLRAPPALAAGSPASLGPKEG